MTRSTLDVTFSQAQLDEIPPHLHRGVVMLLWLDQQGVLKSVEQRFRIVRQGGYNGLHLFIVAVLALMSGARGGLQTFCEGIANHQGRIAALFGLRCLPSASAMSRLLSCLSPELVNEFCTWLLEALDTGGLLASPAVQARDCQGIPWHICDFDPTIETLLRRPLAQPAESPAPERRSEGFATSGYTGRKRGDVRIRRCALAHAGAGVWQFMDLDNGQGDLRPALENALGAARDRARAVDANARVVVRMDGEFGHVPALKIGQNVGVDLLCRLPRPQLLEREEIRQRLQAASWWPVDTVSGFPRHAAEIGWLNLYAGESTPLPEAEANTPVTVRVIAVRSPCGEEAHRGVQIGHEQVELFATTLEEGGWPTAELIELYQGRSALENRFAQEDREFGLDRIFTYHQPGQKWMTAVGMFLWNCEILAGVALHPFPEPARPSTQPHRVRASASLPALFPPMAEAPQAASAVVAPSEAGPAAPSDEVPAASLAREELVEALESAIDAAHWEGLPVGWDRIRGTLALRCPEDRRLQLYYVEHGDLPSKSRRKRQNRVGYRTSVGACDGCPVQQDCRGDARPNTYRFLDKALPPNKARQAYAFFKQLQPAASHRLAERRRLRAMRKVVHAGTATPPVPILADHQPAGPSPLAVQRPTFLPAQARQAFVRRTQALHLRVRITPPPLEVVLAPHPLLRDPRRAAMPTLQSWATRLARYDLPPQTTVTLHITSANGDLGELLAFRGEEIRKLAC